MDERNQTLQIGPGNRPAAHSFRKAATRGWVEAAGIGWIVAAVVLAVVLGALSLWLVATGRISYNPGDLIRLDFGVRFGAVAFAVAAGVRNHQGGGPAVALMSPLVFAIGAVVAALPTLPDQRCFYDGVCDRGEPITGLLVGSYLVATTMLAAGVLLACRPRLKPAEPSSAPKRR